jgi:phosphoglycerate kinase
VRELSLKPIAETLGQLLKHPIVFVDNFVKTYNNVKRSGTGLEPKLTVLENLRFFPGEDKGLISFAKILASTHDYFINESFATAHREASSVVALPSLLPSSIGFQFEKEIASLDKVLGSKDQSVLLLGGAKPDKLEYIEKLKNRFGLVLLGGRLPLFYTRGSKKVIKATLKPHGFDITEGSAIHFAGLLKKAKLIVFNGPLGKSEDVKYRLSTNLIISSLSKSRAFKIAGGGDTQNYLKTSRFERNFNFVSTGGGAMMYYLAYRKLPALVAIKKSPKA